MPHAVHLLQGGERLEVGWELWGGSVQVPSQVVNMEGSPRWVQGLVWDLCYPRLLLQAAFAHAVCPSMPIT